jgi:hypothetical protein
MTITRVITLDENRIRYEYKKGESWIDWEPDRPRSRGIRAFMKYFDQHYYYMFILIHTHNQDGLLTWVWD